MSVQVSWLEWSVGLEVSNSVVGTPGRVYVGLEEEGEQPTLHKYQPYTCLLQEKGDPPRSE